MSFTKLKDSRSTFSLDSVRLRNRYKKAIAPPENQVELFVENNNVYQMDSNGTSLRLLHTPGSVVKVSYAISYDNQTITSLEPQLINGLEIEYTPVYLNSLIIVEANVASSQTYVTTFAIYKDFMDGLGSAPLFSLGSLARSNNSSRDGVLTLFKGSNTPNTMHSATFKVFEINNSSAKRKYEIRALDAWEGVANTLYINNRADGKMASFSTMTVTEIAR